MRMHQRGFTLIELLVVVAIIGLLGTIIAAPVNTARKKARDAKRIADLGAVKSALEQYIIDTGAYPSTGGMNIVYIDPGCNGSPTAPNLKTAEWVPNLVPFYLSALPRDPRPVNMVGGSGIGCYMYASNGTNYVLSAWATYETKTATGTNFYRRVGFRETLYNNSQGCIMNYWFFNTPGSWYDKSITYTSYDESTINASTMACP